MTCTKYHCPRDSWAREFPLEWTERQQHIPIFFKTLRRGLPRRRTHPGPHRSPKPSEASRRRPTGCAAGAVCGRVPRGLSLPGDRQNGRPGDTIPTPYRAGERAPNPREIGTGDANSPPAPKLADQLGSAIRRLRQLVSLSATRRMDLACSSFATGQCDVMSVRIERTYGPRFPRRGISGFTLHAVSRR